MAPNPTAPVLVYDRIAQNRRKTVMLVIIAVLSVVPFVGAISYGVSDFLLSHFSGSRHTRAKYKELEARQRTSFERKLRALEEGGDENVSGIISMERAQEEREMAEIETAAARDRAEEHAMRARIMVVCSIALTIGLGMVFWAIASSPTSKILAMCDARPASPAEAECRRLLDNLAIGSGLPPPKLYVIESSQPNAFAAGVDPEHSVVVVTRALLGLLDERELEGVLAHELSHIGNRDTRLNTFVAAIALFLRLPYLLRKRARQGTKTEWSPMRRYRNYWRFTLTPIYLYIFFIAPVLAAIIRAAISRSREFLADADAALLTRYPEGLIRALSKIRGAGSAVQTANPVVSHLYFADPTTAGFSSGLFGSNLFGSHPPIDQRILRLAEFNSGVAPSVIEEAVRAGQAYTASRPATLEESNHALVAQDELSVLTAGNPVGRVFRVAEIPEPVAVYDRDNPNVKSMVISRVRSGDLLVAFDDPGKMRQILTGDQVFGYIPRTVKLIHVDMLPAELGPHNFRTQPQPAAQPAADAASVGAPSKEEYVPSYVRAAETARQQAAAAAVALAAAPAVSAPPKKEEEYVPSYVRAAEAARQAAEAARVAAAAPPPPPVPEPIPEPVTAFEPTDAPAAVPAAKPLGISGKQLGIAAAFAVVVFAGITIVLFTVVK